MYPKNKRRKNKNKPGIFLKKVKDVSPIDIPLSILWTFEWSNFKDCSFTFWNWKWSNLYVLPLYPYIHTVLAYNFLIFSNVWTIWIIISNDNIKSTDMSNQTVQHQEIKCLYRKMSIPFLQGIHERSLDVLPYKILSFHFLVSSYNAFDLLKSKTSESCILKYIA